MIDRIGTIYAEKDIELLWSIKSSVDSQESQIGQLCDWLYRCVVYVENETELSWLIRPSEVCEENQTGQWRDWS